MKIMYTCTLEIMDDIPDEYVDRAYNISEIEQNLVSSLSEMITEKGEVTIVNDALKIEVAR